MRSLSRAFLLLLAGVGCSSSSFEVGAADTGGETAEETAAPRCGDGVVDKATEECDDGNGVDHDGCDKDCTFSCNSTKAPSKGCGDGKACNGAETCSDRHVCAPGPAVSCPPTSACHTAICTEPAGTCTNTLVDGDKDGQSPSTLGACGKDCDDADEKSFAGQTKFFTTPAKRGGFDYDCDGVETKQFDTFVKCNLADCSLGAEGWFFAGGATPPCGATGDWITECFVNGSGACVPRPASTVKRVQACR